MTLGKFSTDVLLFLSSDGGTEIVKDRKYRPSVSSFLF